VKKAALFTLSAILFYGLLRDQGMLRFLLICGGLACAYGIYRLPARFVMAAKYPAILLSFAATAGFFFYPHVVARPSLQVLILLLSFYSLTFYLVTMDDRKNSLFKETAALSTLFLTSAFNLAMVGQATFILSLTLALILFLYIIDRLRIIPFIAGYALIITILLYRKGIPVMGSLRSLYDVEQYLLLAATFVLLLISFIGILKQTGFVKMLPFFGFLYVAIDVFLVVGLGFSGGLLHQPILALLVVSPLVGLMLKPEGGRA
jgi:hypothetical protein